MPNFLLQDFSQSFFTVFLFLFLTLMYVLFMSLLRVLTWTSLVQIFLFFSPFFQFLSKGSLTLFLDKNLYRWDDDDADDARVDTFCRQ